MKGICLATCIVCFSVTSSWAQVELSIDQLISNCEGWASRQNEDQAKWVKKDWKTWLEDGNWRQGQIDTLSSTIELLQKSRFPFFPAGRGYAEATMMLMNAQDTVQWVEWHAFIQFMESKRSWKKALPQFLGVSGQLFEAGVIVDEPNLQWRLEGGVPRFECDSIPLVRFLQGDLIGVGRGDRVSVEGTEGVWDVTKEQFHGGSGRVTWAGTSLDSITHYAEFDSFELRLDGNTLKVEDARFHSGFVADVLLGRLTAKLQSHRSPEDKSYPKFETYENILEINNISPGVHYAGGITINGSNLQGTGVPGQPSVLRVIHQDTLLFKVSALTFLFTSRGISSDHSSASMFYQGDSIHHPDCQFRLDDETGRLSLNRSDEGLSRQPFVDSYHAMNLDVESLQWERGKTTVEMGGIPGAVNRAGSFTSFDFFKAEAYRSIQGLADRHPLKLLDEFSRATGLQRFLTLDFAEFIHLNELSTRMLLIDLANQGFLQMDLESLMCQVLPKARNFLANAAGRRDYDVIQLNSFASNGVNGSMSLLNGRLKLEGIQPFQLSDSQDVRVIPANGILELSENRNFDFDGQVIAGKLEMNGMGFGFNYENFEIELTQIDEVKIQVDDPAERDSYGRPMQRWVQSSLREVSGTLSIDDPLNRSGRRSRQFNQYPILESMETSYVYYDDPRILGGQYERDRFHFAVEPFTMNRLDQFLPEDLRFKGTLISDGILPDIEQPLELMPDFSLGISTKTTSEGKSLYGGLAHYTEGIQLDLNGLHGGGVIDFKTAHAEGQDFTFLPQKAIGVTTLFTNRSDEGLDVPFVDGIGGDLVFEPYENRLFCSTGKDSLVSYYKGVTFSGELTYVDSGLFASGVFYTGKAQFNASRFQMTQFHLKSDSSNVEIFGLGKRLAFSTDGVLSDVNFQDRYGDFQALQGETRIDLPLNQYEVVMDRFRWFMDTDEIALESDRTYPEERIIEAAESRVKSNFYSLHPQQDGLHFLSPRARYDLVEAQVSCQDVEFLELADAQVIPDSGRVTIKRFAALEPLEHATVIANRVTQYHRIDDANILIEGRMDFKGSGTYIYKDLNGSPFEITFSEVFVDGGGETRAKGMVVVDDDFTLSPAFSYAGEVHLKSTEPLLRFAGGTKMLHTCVAFEPEWIAFDALIDPQNVSIPLGDAPQSIDRNSLTSGIVVSGGSPYTAYPTFLTDLGDEDDSPLIMPMGQLRHDPKGQRFVISDEIKFANPEARGNLIELTASGCDLKASGRIQMPVDYGLMTHEMVGETWVDDQGKLRMNGTLMLDFLFDDKLLERIASQIPMWQDTQPLDIFASGYDQALRELVGVDQSDEALAELSLSGRFKRVPKELRHTLVFSGIDFIYDPSEESFVSEGELGLVLLGNEQVFMKVRGKIEVQRMKTGDWLRMYLHGGQENWYYFDYRLGTLNVSTSDGPFLDILLEVKANNRSIKEDGKRFGFQAMGSPKRRNDFVDRFREFD